MAVCPACGTSYGPNIRICVRDGTPLTGLAKPDQYLGTLLEGKYRIDALVGSGGMGSVYRAEHVLLGKTVAVKVINHNLVTSDEVVVRFQREARAVASLDHPNIVTVYDLGQLPDGTLYIAMEYIDGPTLKSRIRRSGPLAPDECIVLLRQVASGLSFAHRKHIVHRDLKSDNLMLTSDDGRAVVKLVDFGIAKTFDESTQLTVTGYMMGTPQYMSPEQAAGAPVDHRADLYSLGVILYEALTGTVPFADATLSSMLVRLATEVPPPPSTHRSDGQLPPALDAVVMRCLEKDPRRRFQTADDFADALDAAAVDDGSRTVLVPPSLDAAHTAVRPVPASQFTAAAARTSSPRPLGRVPVGSSKRKVAAVALVLVSGAIAFAVNRLDSSKAIATSTSVSDANARQPPGNAQPDPPPDAGRIAESGNRAPVESPSLSASTPFERVAAAPLPPPEAESTRVPRERPSPAPDTALIEAEAPVAAAPPRPEPVKSDPATSVPNAPAAVVPSAPAAYRAPSVAVACEADSDVCAVIRDEVIRQLRSNFYPDPKAGAADIVLTVNLNPVSDRIRTGATPVMVHTISVALTGRSARTSVAMPAPRVFEYDSLFGRAQLQQNAQSVAADAIEAVRSFAARQ